MEFLKYKSEEEIAASCYVYAQQLYESRHNLGIEIDSVGQLADLIYDMFMDKAKQDHMTDRMIDYNDEIVSIEEDCVTETMDITVSKDSLFYANGILTKNSFGLPATLDWYIAITMDEVLADNKQQMIHLLKTRWGNKSKVKPQIVGIDFDKMRYSDVGISNNNSVKEVQEKAGKGKKPKVNVNDIDWN